MIGRTVSHYRIVSELGHGGFGVVYIAEDTHLGRRVALKFSTAPPQNAQYRARFLREARAASALNHPNIAGIYDYGETTEGQPFIVMELVEGTDLHHLIRQGTLPVAQIADITARVCEALGEAHRRGILHRDIKPSNIIITPAGDVKVLDFGLAKQIETEATAEMHSPMLTSDTIEGQVLGTPAYMSPEQVRDEPLGPQSDVFAVGSVMYECLTGRPPFSGKTPVDILASVLHVEPAPPSRLNRSVPPRLDSIVMRALAKQKEARYQTADDLLADLRGLSLALEKAETQETLLLPATGARTAALSGGIASRISRTIATLAPLKRSRLAVAVALVALAASALWVFLPGGAYQPAPEAVRWYQEGVSALRDGTYYKASQALVRAVTRDPQFSMAHARLAEAYLELEYWEKAKDEMLRAIPPGSKPRLTRAEQEYEQAIGFTLTGDLPAAVQKYRDIADRAPDSEKANALLDLGRAYERKEDLKSALVAYQDAAKRQPQNPAVLLHLGILFGRQVDQARALPALREAESIYRGLSNFEGVAEVQYQGGVLANRLGRFAEARASLDQALEMSRHIGSVSQEIPALIQLSNVEQHQNNMSQAEADAAKAIELARANGLETLTMRGLIDLGNAFFARGEVEEGRKYFTQSLEYASRYHAERAEMRALLSLGSLEIQHNETDAGLGHVKQALDWYQRHGYQKETIQALTLLARTERRRGDYAAALESFRKQLDLSRQLGLQPQAALASQGMGTVLTSQGRWPEALASFRDAFEAASHSGADFNLQYAYLNLAGALWRLGRYREAQQQLDKIVKPSRELANDADHVAASMALSQRQFASAAEKCRRVLAQPAIHSDLMLSVKLILGSALLGAGSRSEASATLAEVSAAAKQSGNPQLIAEAELAQSEALLAAGDAPRALEGAMSAAQFYERIGNPEGEWHCRLAAARAGAPEEAKRALDSIARLQQKWDPDSYASYGRRPDIQYERAQLARLAVR